MHPGLQYLQFKGVFGFGATALEGSGMAGGLDGARGRLAFSALSWGCATGADAVSGLATAGLAAFAGVVGFALGLAGLALGAGVALVLALAGFDGLALAAGLVLDLGAGAAFGAEALAFKPVPTAKGLVSIAACPITCATRKLVSII